MDAETRAYFDQVLGALRSDVSREFEGLRHEFGTLRGEFGTLHGGLGALRGEIGTLHGEIGTLHRGLGALRGEIGTLHGEIETLRGEFGTLHGGLGVLRGEFGTLHEEFAALRQEVRDTAAETRRHFDVVAEYLRHDIRGIAEGVIGLSERMDRLGTGLGTEMNERFAATHAVVRVAFQEVRREIEELRTSL